MAPNDREPIARINKRLTEGLDDVNARIDQGFAGLRDAIDSLADQVRRSDARSTHGLVEQAAALTRAFSHLELGVGELRDRVQLLEREGLPRATASAAEGAARGAGQAAGEAAAATARITAAVVAKGFWATTMGKLVGAAVAFTALVTGIGAVPDAARGLTRFWIFLQGGK